MADDYYMPVDAKADRDSLLARLEGERSMTRNYEHQLQMLKREHAQLQGELALFRGCVARIEALCNMNHDDSLVRVGDIRAALRGGP